MTDTEAKAMQKTLSEIEERVEELQDEGALMRKVLTNHRARFKLEQYITWKYGKTRRLGRVIDHRLAGDVIAFICQTIRKDGTEGIYQEIRDIDKPELADDAIIPNGLKK